MTALPKQVMEQLEEAERLYEELVSSTGQESVEGDKPDTETGQETAAESDSEQQPQPQEQPQAQPQADYEKEELKRRVEMLEKLLSQVQTPAQESSQEPEKAEEPETPLISDKDIEDFGEDTVDFVKRAVQQELKRLESRLHQVEQTLNQWNSSIVPQVQQVAQSHIDYKEQQFWSRLSEAVPNWEEINNSQGWLDWLRQPEGLSGIQRVQFLQDAQRNYDVDRVIGFFNAYLGDTGTSSGSDAKAKQQKMISPGKARTSPASTDPQGGKSGKVFSRSDIQKFYTNVSTGKYTPEQKAAIEREIEQAMLEGRIKDD
ncbi:MAG: hypothetical protein QW318_07150 [Candidatus Caldarchaeum sp.]